MSSVNSVTASSTPYQPITPNKPATTPTKPAPTAAGNDPDHDGDTDGKGLDVNG
jgi:hypothetical protein